jgi:uncharacterized protein YfdQ (DUF2303 family)
MSELTEAEVIRDLAYEAAVPATLEPGRRYAWHGPDGVIREVDLTDDMPARKSGTVMVRDIASFAAYFSKHADDATEVFADIDNATVTAVLDAHHGHGSDQMEYPARWQGHRLVLQLQTSLPWRTWLEFDRKMRPQADFADFLEDNYRDLADGGLVAAADLLEVAQDLQAAIKVEFQAGTRLQSGQTRVAQIETIDAKGAKGKIAIPEEFDLGIAPYEDCDEARIAARFRYRITADGLKLGYFLNQPERHRQEAVKAIVAKVDAVIGDLTVMLGSSA